MKGDEGAKSISTRAGAVLRSDAAFSSGRLNARGWNKVVTDISKLENKSLGALDN